MSLPMHLTIEAVVSLITLCITILTAAGMLVQRLTKLEILLGEHIKNVEKWISSIETRVTNLERR